MGAVSLAARDMRRGQVTLEAVMRWRAARRAAHIAAKRGGLRRADQAGDADAHDDLGEQSHHQTLTVMSQENAGATRSSRLCSRGGGSTADDAHLSRTQLVLGDRRRKALTKELERTIARVERIEEQAHKRLGHEPDRGCGRSGPSRAAAYADFVAAERMFGDYVQRARGRYPLNA